MINNPTSDIDNQEIGLKRTMCEVMNYEPYLDLEEVKKVCATKAADGILQQYVIVRHDQDVVTDEDVKKNTCLQAGSLKSPHIHVFMRFKHSRYFSEIANWFHIQEQYVHKIQAHSFDAAIPYAIHANAKNKHQYSINEVYTNFDYQAVIEAYYKKQAKKETGQVNDARRAEIINGIMNGTITESTLSKHVTATEEDRFNSSIRNTFARKKRDLTMNKDRNMKVIYICGASGAGKTTFAKMLCRSLGWSFFISGSKRDPLQGLTPDTDAIILDDLAPDTFEWKELLKLLDNHTASAAAARFSDKFVNCKMIIITNTKSIEAFCSYITGAHGEDEYQLYRRVTTVYNVFSKTIEELELDHNTRRYKVVRQCPNRIVEYIQQHGAKPLPIATDPNDVFSKLLPKTN